MQKVESGCHPEKSATVSSLELTGLVTAIANALASGLTGSEIALAASLFVQLGDTLATIVTARALCEERAEENNIPPRT